MSRCQRCETAYGWGRPANFASDPICAFASGAFSAPNWNCITANRLRELAGDSLGERPRSFSWVCRDDNAAASFGAFWVPEHNDGGGFYVAMSWYKNRGATGQIWGFRDDEIPHALTLIEAEEAIASVEALQERERVRALPTEQETPQ